MILRFGHALGLFIKKAGKESPVSLHTVGASTRTQFPCLQVSELSSLTTPVPQEALSALLGVRSVTLFLPVFLLAGPARHRHWPSGNQSMTRC